MKGDLLEGLMGVLFIAGILLVLTYAISLDHEYRMERVRCEQQ